MSLDKTDKSYKAVFFVTPHRISDLPNITMTFFKIYETIFQFWNSGQKCFLSNRAIMERTGIKSESTVREALMFFEKHGEMRREKRGNRRYLVQPTQYVETDPVDNSQENSTKTFQGVENATGGRRERDGQGVENATHNNNNINTKNINKSSYIKKEQKEDNEKKHEWADKKETPRPQPLDATNYQPAPSGELPADSPLKDFMNQK